jgi:hypothetical protein
MMVFVFNVFLDWAAISAILAALVWARDAIDWHKTVASLGIIAATAFGGFIVSMLCYRMFLSGNTGVFAQLLFVVPLSAIWTIAGGGLIGLCVLYNKTVGLWYRVGGFVLGSILVGTGVMMGRNIWVTWESSNVFGNANNPLAGLSYLLAIATVLPAAIVLIVMAMAFIGQLMARPMVAFQWGYMTFVKEEMSGTQAAGLIALLGVATGAAIGIASSV